VIYSLAAFVAAAVVAVPWALWAKWCAERHAWRAAFADGAIHLMTAVTTIGVIESKWNVFPMAAGAILGTKLALSFGKPDEALPQ